MTEKSFAYEKPAYCLEITNDGVYLTVYPTAADISSLLDDINEEIHVRAIQEVDPMEVRKACFFKARKHLIAPTQPLSKKDGVIAVEVSKDEMNAVCTLFPPLGDGNPVTKEQLHQILSSKNISFGIDEVKINEIITSKKPVRSCIIAQGQPMQEGSDASIKYFFSTSMETPKPKVLENGRVDYYNLDLIQNVVEGQLIARKMPAVPGVNGVTVTGKLLEPPPPKDVPLPKGKNTVVSDDGLTLTAKIAGHVQIQSGRVCVMPVYIVPGDVDFSTGNINFIGSVQVLGSVRKGFRVNAAGDVEVKGRLEGGSINTGGNIAVKEGILGQGKGSIRAGGSIFARFIEHAYIEAGENVLVGDSIMHSVVRAGDKIIVNGKNGKIVGGLCFAGQEIEAKVIGSNIAVTTELEIGISSQDFHELNKLAEEENAIKEQLQKINSIFSIVSNFKGSGHILHGYDYNSLIATKDNLLTKLDLLYGKRTKILANLKYPDGGKVRVKECLYPGVTIRFGTTSYSVRDEMSYICLYIIDDEVKIAPYS